MSQPLISICLPNLNTRPYLEPRVESIWAQTYRNWELIVSDNYSDDGAWAFFEDLARRDRRVVAEQAPREGIYANWNRCIRRARGEFVYIATSDDTMAADCLEKLVAALQRHPDCDLAHCRLRKVDEHGVEKPDIWSRQSVFALSSGELIDRPHVRRAPFDGLLHLRGRAVYTSITQLLIRRSLFDRIGYFNSRWGSLGDFNWNMRAGLVANTVHVPDTWAGWRVHASQATALNDFMSAAHARKIDEMIDDAIERSRGLLPARFDPQITARWAAEAKQGRRFQRDDARRRRLIGSRADRIVKRILAKFASPRMHPTVDWVKRCFEEVGSGPPLYPALAENRSTSEEMV